MPRRFLLFFLWALLSCDSALFARPSLFTGPFELRQFLAMYVVNTAGEPFTITLRWSEDARAHMDRPLLVRVFDPEERLIIRHDATGARRDVTSETIQLEVPASGAGVYQVALTGFRPTVHFETQPGLAFGLFGYPELFVRGDQFANAYIHVPPALHQLTVRSSEGHPDIIFKDESGKVRLDARGLRTASVELPGGGEHVWRISVKSQQPATINFGGMPIILCPDETSARTIRSSVDVLADGTICFHKFQVRAHEILSRFRSLPSEEFNVRVPSLPQFKQAWLSEPERNRMLLGGYGVYSALDVVLSEQVIDRESPWFGCIHAHRDVNGRVRKANPWTSIDRLGMTRAAATINTLAAVYSIREPFNPLAGDRALLNRIIIAAMQELMMLREHEMPMPEYIEYPGGDRAFTFAKYTLAFSLVARECPPNVREVWTEGLQRCVDHQLYGVVPNTVNQWSFTIRGIQQFAEGVDDPWYDDIVRRSIDWLLTRNQNNWGFMPAGYFAESGPDATYVGITLHNLGWVFRRTGNTDLRDALQRCVDLFNHTVAPEPDGSWQEVTNFNSRTPDGWSKPQWSIGLSMLMGEIDDVLPVARRAIGDFVPAHSPTARRSAESRTTGMLSYLNRQAFRDFQEITLSDAADMFFLAWQEFPEQVLEGDLPVNSADGFTRVFGDEFMCVRRPSYYAFIYSGSPMDDWQKAQRPSDPRAQYPRNGGGLCMFWTPELGASLLAKNWSAYAANGIIVEHHQTANWEDYWSVSPRLDADSASAHIRSRVLGHPISVSREWRFEQSAVTCSLSLEIEADLDEAQVWESLPFTLTKSRPLRVSLLNERGQRVENNQPVTAIAFFDSQRLTDEVHLIVFDQPRVCQVQIERSVDQYGGKREHGCILAQMSRSGLQGRTSTQWQITSTNAGAVAEQIARIRSGLRHP